MKPSTLSPPMVKPSFCCEQQAQMNELAASAAEARLHIEMLHAVIKIGDLKTASLIIADWEDGQC
jgi:hypothetical protein